MRFSVCGLLGVWDIQDVGCLECGMFTMWDILDVRCWEYEMLECGMMGMHNVQDLACSRCEMYEILNVGDLQSLTKHLRQTLISCEIAHYGKISIFQEHLLVLTKFSFREED